MKGGGAPIDVVITTYNRPQSVVRLVNELRGCSPAPGMIIVVDSSDERNRYLEGVEGVRCIRAKHKNQPYQRYVGLLTCRSEAVLMLDDDLYVEKTDVFGRYSSCLNQPNVVGVSVGVDIESAIPPLFCQAPKGIRGLGLGLWARFRPSVAAGRIGLGGQSGGFPVQDAFVEFFPGANMCFTRDVALKLFDETLFALFEKKLAMGEDKAISMKANRYGQLFRHAETCFRHPPELQSSYGAAREEYLAKVLISRLYLSRVYCDVFGKPRWIAKVHFPTVLVRALFSGLARGKDQTLTAARAIKRALEIIWGTGLQASRLTPGVDYWADAVGDVDRSEKEIEQ